MRALLRISELGGHDNTNLEPSGDCSAGLYLEYLEAN